MRLSEFLEQRAEATTAKLMTAIARTSLRVWEAIPFQTGLLAGVNPSGERQTAIDVFANDAFVDSLMKTGGVAEVGSEEMEATVKGSGPVSVAMDPLDGTSNIETNNAVGSIFGLYAGGLPCSGRQLASAAYITYGPMLTLTLSLGKGVQRFVAVREGSDYRFDLMDEGIRIPEKPGVYGVGGRPAEWIPPVRRLVDSFEGRGMKERYCGTFVGDFNQVLKHGGLFAYPALVGKPKGKLRILYETSPMGFIAEQAGGYATDGRRRLLDVEPTGMADTTPAYLGSAQLAHEAEREVTSG